MCAQFRPVGAGRRVGIFHVAIAVHVAVIAVAVRVDAVVPRIGRIVGLNAIIGVVALLALHPAILVAVVVAEVVAVGVEVVGLTQIAVGVGSVVAGVVFFGDAGIDRCRIECGQIRIVELRAIDAVVSVAAVDLWILAGGVAIAVLIEVAEAVAIAVDAVVPGLLCIGVDLACSGLNPARVDDLKIIWNGGRVVPAVRSPLD